MNPLFPKETSGIGPTPLTDLLVLILCFVDLLSFTLKTVFLSIESPSPGCSEMVAGWGWVL